MATLRARHGDRMVTVQASPGATLREALDRTGLDVRTGCNGNGSCGLCRVRVRAGAVAPLTAQEQLSLGPALLDGGVRLACQAVLLGDVDLEVESLALGTTWSAIPSGDLAGPGVRPAVPAGAGKVLRIALDVGTTNLNLTLWSAAGARLASLRGLNPQAGFGADVVTRLQAAVDPAVARQLAGVVEQAVAAALRAFAPDEGAPCAITAVGNTAMLALLQGSQAALLDPGTWSGPAPAPPEPPLRWELSGGREARVALVPPLGGFVGSDLLAAVLAAGLLAGDGPALLVDFGTNTEIALWDGAVLWVTSASGGPAFEACGLHCAVPADEGAIHRVMPGAPFFEVIGGGEPKGVCATGLVDWIACLAADGTLTRTGAFHRPGAVSRLGAAGSGIVLAKRDVDLFQRAKAAIAAGIQALLRSAGIGGRDLGRVVTTGLFGRGLDIGNAQAIGLLPRVPAERVETHFNLALAGCEQLATSADGARALDPLRARARLINLARFAGFEDLYLEGLYLGPMGDP